MGKRVAAVLGYQSNVPDQAVDERGRLAACDLAQVDPDGRRRPPAGASGPLDSGTTHESVNHSTKEYVRGDVHTNTAESAFSLFKRSVVGSFHQVSGKHLDRYLEL